MVPIASNLSESPLRPAKSTTGDPDELGDARPPAISLRNVSKRYGDHLALEPHDLDIEEGEFFCLLGPSGCGKTTTLNLIGGFVGPTAGEIRIRGERVDRLPPNRRRVNTVFQSYALFPHMDVQENVGFGLRMSRVPRQEAARRVAETLSQVGLEKLASRMPAELSGGQQQRVAVARALINRPAVLLLDEPLGALDLKMRKRLQVELAQIHREVGTTFVYVTHDQEEAMAMAGRIAVMNDGRIQQVGTPEEIYHRPASRFVAGFIGESNFVERRSVPPALGGGDALGLLMVRPEAVCIAAPGAGPAHALEARVVQTAFLGSSTRVAVRCAQAEEPITVAINRRDRGGTSLEPGAEVAIWWDVQDAVPLVEEARETKNEEPR
jgi:spermidine/putrescine transport system ATP-binding protein